MTTTWNPSDKGANITLSGSDLVATMGAATPNIVRSVHGFSGSEKIYFEVVCTTAGGAVGFGVGISNSSELVSTYLGDTNNSISYYADAPLYINDVSVLTLTTYTSGDVIGVAVDNSANKIWVRKNSGSWNNSGSDDPSTATGGYSLSGVITGTRYAALEMENSGGVGTARFSSGSWTLGAPSGFGEINPSIKSLLLFLGVG